MLNSSEEETLSIDTDILEQPTPESAGSECPINSPVNSQNNSQRAVKLDQVKKAKKCLPRLRSVYTASQSQQLIHRFQRSQYLPRQERVELAAQLRLSDHQVKIWFQNRRSKLKKLMRYIRSDEVALEVNSNFKRGPRKGTSNSCPPTMKEEESSPPPTKLQHTSGSQQAIPFWPFNPEHLFGLSKYGFFQNGYGGGLFMPPSHMGGYLPAGSFRSPYIFPFPNYAQEMATSAKRFEEEPMTGLALGGSKQPLWTEDFGSNQTDSAAGDVDECESWRRPYQYGDVPSAPQEPSYQEFEPSAPFTHTAFPSFTEVQKGRYQQDAEGNLATNPCVGAHDLQGAPVGANDHNMKGYN